MRYTIMEEMLDGRSYAVVERNDGTTFGQIVDLRGAADDAEVDARMAAAIDTADEIAKAIEARKTAPDVNRVGTSRTITLAPARTVQ
ncbi:MAG TPA: hypothetical protein VFV90_10885 [Usitatibacter sp.]|nr:hypothetical protein [Usitatibacter sp.]